MFNYLTFLCTPHRWCCIKKYLLSFKERKNWVTTNVQIHTKEYFMYYIWKKQQHLPWFLACKMWYNKIQLFGGISHLVIFSRGEIILYLDVMHYIANRAHAIITTDEYWTVRLFMRNIPAQSTNIMLITTNKTCPSFFFKKNKQKNFWRRSGINNPHKSYKDRLTVCLSFNDPTILHHCKNSLWKPKDEECITFSNCNG